MDAATRIAIDGVTTMLGSLAAAINKLTAIAENNLKTVNALDQRVRELEKRNER
jgi:hypothetical protein